MTSNRLSRRSLLTALPATGAALAVAAPAEAESQTPVMQLFGQWCRMRDRLERISETVDPGRLTNDRMDRLYAPRDRIEARILAEPCQTAGDFAAKMIIETCLGGLAVQWENNPVWQEARFLVGKPNLGLG